MKTLTLLSMVFIFLNNDSYAVLNTKAVPDHGHELAVKGQGQIYSKYVFWIVVPIPFSFLWI